MIVQPVLEPVEMQDPQTMKHTRNVTKFTTIKVARDEDLAEQIGRDIIFDLVDHDRVRSFRIQNRTPFNLFKEKVAKEFRIPVHFQRFWIWAERQNDTYRPDRPLTPQEELQSVGELREVSNNAELKLFLEVEFGPDLHPLPPPYKSKDDILLFFKLYEPSKQELRFVGRLFVKTSSKPVEILTKLNQFAGFSPDQEIELFEEIKFEPCIMCKHLDKEISFRLSQIEDGDIICFQKSIPLSSEQECKYPDVPSFLEYILNHQVIHFRSLEQPKEDGFILELSKLHTYDDVTEKVAEKIGLDDPTKIRLSAHNCYSQQPKHQPIKFRGVKHLSDMLVHYRQSSDILYYEVLDIPLPQLQGLKNLKVAFHHTTTDKVVIHNVRLPKQSTVGDVIDVLKTEVELSNPNAELRLLEIFFHKIYKIFPQSEKIENINDHYWTIRLEEIPEEEKNMGVHDRLIHVYHFTKDTTQNPMQVQSFGEPFLLVIYEGETLAEVKVRIQKKLHVPNEEFSKWKFAILLPGSREYLQDSDIVSSRLQKKDYGAWEHFLGLQHSDNAPKRAYINNQAAQITLKATDFGHETTSRKIDAPMDLLDGPSSSKDEQTLRRLSAAEELLKSTSPTATSAEAVAALSTVSRYVRGSLATLCTDGAYEEFTVGVKLLTKQGIIPSSITSVLKGLLESLEIQIPKYMAAEKELAKGNQEIAPQHREIKSQMELAIQKCKKRKYIVDNYDVKVAELEAELARVKANRAEAMMNLRTAVDEMEPLKSNFAGSSSRYESFAVMQARLTVEKGASLGTWDVVKDVLKNNLEF